MSERRFVTTGTAWEEIAGYARAVRVGEHIAVAGTTAVDADSKLVGAGDPGTQARFILDKIEKALQQLITLITQMPRIEWISVQSVKSVANAK